MMNNASANCYGRKAMLAQPVLHQLAMEEIKTTSITSAAPVVQKTNHTSKETSKDLLERKMELHEKETTTSRSKAKDKLVQIWQHIISQSSAPASQRGGGCLMRR